MLSRTSQLLASIAAVSILFISAAGCAAQDLQDRILWIDQEKREALFLPESALEGKELADLPLHPHNLEAIQFKIKIWTDPRNAWDDCLPAFSYAEAGSRQDAKPIATLIVESDVAVRGRIQDLVVGWNVHDGAITRMVYIRADQVLTDRGGVVEIGDLLAVAMPGGALELAGWEFCQSQHERHQGLEFDSEVLIVGSFWPQHPPYLGDAVVLPIIEGVLETRSYGELIPEPSQSWSALQSKVEALKSSAQQEKGGE